MKWFIAITVGLLSLLLLTGKGQRDKTLKDFGGGLKYVRWAELDCRVIAHAGFNTEEAVVPGDVLWCRVEKGFIVGEKAWATTPVAWMERADWECHGFFLLNRSLLNFSASTDEQRTTRAINWFETKDELERALKTAKAD